jgi:hypothetical protein
VTVHWAPAPLRVVHRPAFMDKKPDPMPYTGPVRIKLPGQATWIRATTHQAQDAWRAGLPVAPEPNGDQQ